MRRRTLRRKPLPSSSARINLALNVVPPDPHDEFATLGTSNIGGGWEGGAVAPAMFRTMAHMLPVALPKAERAQLGRLLNESAEYDSNLTRSMAAKGMESLQRLLASSRAAKLLAIRKVGQENNGRKTPGIDGVVSSSVRAVKSLRKRDKLLVAVL
jgi:hypothetical protein